MLRLTVFSLLLISFVACTEESNTSSDEHSTESPQPVIEKTTTQEEFSSYFSPTSGFSDLGLDPQGGMGVAFELSKSSFEGVSEDDMLPTNIVHDWITPHIQEMAGEVDESNWHSIFYNETSTVSIYCFVQFVEEDLKFYLLRLNAEDTQNNEFIHLGNISTFKYKDASDVPNEEYDFDITDCEELSLIISGDTLWTKCMRYSSTVGQDWRVDQNLNVNDTVKLPIIENSYALY